MTGKRIYIVNAWQRGNVTIDSVIVARETPKRYYFEDGARQTHLDKRGEWGGMISKDDRRLFLSMEDAKEDAKHKLNKRIQLHMKDIDNMSKLIKLAENL